MQDGGAESFADVTLAAQGGIDVEVQWCVSPHVAHYRAGGELSLHSLEAFQSRWREVASFPRAFTALEPLEGSNLCRVVVDVAAHVIEKSQDERELFF